MQDFAGEIQYSLSIAFCFLFLTIWGLGLFVGCCLLCAAAAYLPLNIVPAVVIKVMRQIGGSFSGGICTGERCLGKKRER